MYKVQWYDNDFKMWRTKNTFKSFDPAEKDFRFWDTKRKCAWRILVVHEEVILVSSAQEDA
jgi:hypothetical protein